MTYTTNSAIRMLATVGVVSGAAFSQASSGQVVGWGLRGGQVSEMPPNLTGVLDVDIGVTWAIALKSDHEVIGWGSHAGYPFSTPLSLGPCKGIAAGYQHALALRMDGTIFAWGLNQYGECNVPDNIGACIQVDAQSLNSAALTAAGQVRVWGYYFNNFEIPPSQPCNMLAVGRTHVVAIQENGLVAAWPQNGSVTTTVPPDLGVCVKVAANNLNTFALQEGGQVRAWGLTSGGDGGYFPSTLGPCADIDIENGGGIALRQDGSSVRWSTKSYWSGVTPNGITDGVAVVRSLSNYATIRQDGSLAIGGIDGPYPGYTPIVGTIPGGLSQCQRIAAGALVAAGLNETHNVVAWGNTITSQTWVNFPTDLGPCRWIGGGIRNCAAIRMDGTVAVWGDNYYGVCNPPPTLGKCREIATGNQQAIALREDGTVIQWGIVGGIPVPASLGQCRRIAMSQWSFGAIKAEGKLVMWGDADMMGPASELGPCLDLSMGGMPNWSDQHALAIKQDQTVAQWHSPSYLTVEQPPADLGTVTQVAVGSNHFVALQTNGQVVCWGSEYDGACAIPAQLGRVSAISASYACTLAILDESCPSDLNRDQVVDGNDLMLLLTAWGTSGGDWFADIDHSGSVTGNDLARLMAAWDECASE